MSKTLTLLALLTSSAAFAQVPRAHVYVAQGFGQIGDNGPAFTHTAFGAQGAVWKGVTIGGEAGAIYNPASSLSVVGFLNLSGGYHFTAGRQDTKWDPYVLAGPTLAVRSGSAAGFHVAGGVNYWFSKRLGLKTEFRVNAISSDYSRLPEFRIGLAFR